MDLGTLHAMVRDLARGGEPAREGADQFNRLSTAEREAMLTLRHRLREIGGFASLTPVSGSSIWMAPPLREQAE